MQGALQQTAVEEAVRFLTLLVIKLVVGGGRTERDGAMSAIPLCFFALHLLRCDSRF